MYLLIEHNGSSEHLKYYKGLKFYLEEEFGATVEDVIGRFDNIITVYNIDLKKVCEIDDKTPYDYVGFFIQEDEN